VEHQVLAALEAEVQPLLAGHQEPELQELLILAAAEALEILVLEELVVLGLLSLDTQFRNTKINAIF
jgi:hypothetical protein